MQYRLQAKFLKKLMNNHHASPQVDFQTLLQQAAALKAYSQRPFRRRYDSYPVWYQNTAHASDTLIEIRESKDSSRILTFATESKIRGNALFKSQLYDEASIEYENALGVFKWLHHLDEQWQTKEIEDATLEERSFHATDEGVLLAANDLQLSLLLNIGKCYQHLLLWSHCIHACDSALELDQNSVKALYLRAQARTLPLSCGVVENNVALNDLKRAAELAPSNAIVVTAYNKLRLSLKRQEKKDIKLFSGLFDRGSVYNLAETSKRKAEEGGDNMTVQDALVKIKDAEAAADQMDRDGQVQQAYDLRQQVHAVRASYDIYIDERKQEMERLEQLRSQYDFYNPSDEMIREAANAGIDLTDKRMQRILHELKSSKVEDGKVQPLIEQVINKLKRESAFEVATKLLQDIPILEMDRMLAFRLARGNALKTSNANELRYDEKVDGTDNIEKEEENDDDDVPSERLLQLIVNDLLELQSTRAARGSTEYTMQDTDDSIQLLASYGCQVPINKSKMSHLVTTILWVIVCIALFGFINTSKYLSGFRQAYLYGAQRKRDPAHDIPELSKLYSDAKKEADIKNQLFANEFITKDDYLAVNPSSSSAPGESSSGSSSSSGDDGEF